MPGVAIATALMPPICTAGYGLAIEMYDFYLGLFIFFDQLCLYHANQHCWNKNYDEKSALSSFKELNIKMKIGLISLIVLLVLPASYSAVTLTMNENENKRSNSS